MSGDPSARKSVSILKAFFAEARKRKALGQVHTKGIGGQNTAQDSLISGSNEPTIFDGP